MHQHNNFYFKSHKQALNYYIYSRNYLSYLKDSSFTDKDDKICWKGRDVHAGVLIALNKFFNLLTELEKKIFILYEIEENKSQFIASDLKKSEKLVIQIIKKNTKLFKEELKRFELLE